MSSRMIAVRATFAGFRHHVPRADFVFDAERDRYTCPAGNDVALTS
jgi:hypothetical protein